eukprot:761366-Hanusia_phi.AAC.1
MRVYQELTIDGHPRHKHLKVSSFTPFFFAMFSELYIPSNFTFGMQPAIASTSVELMAKQAFLSSNASKSGSKYTPPPPHALGAVKPARFQMLRGTEAEQVTLRLLAAQKQSRNCAPW